MAWFTQDQQRTRTFESFKDNLYRAVLDYKLNYTESDKKDKDGRSFDVEAVQAKAGKNSEVVIGIPIP